MTQSPKAELFHEVFQTPPNFPTKEGAQYALEKIRDCHPESSGWHEVDAYVEKCHNGLWRAVREHYKD